jgi:hypothetical protein
MLLGVPPCCSLVDITDTHPRHEVTHAAQNQGPHPRNTCDDAHGLLLHPAFPLPLAYAQARAKTVLGLMMRDLLPTGPTSRMHMWPSVPAAQGTSKLAASSEPCTVVQA